MEIVAILNYVTILHFIQPHQQMFKRKTMNNKEQDFLLQKINQFEMMGTFNTLKIEDSYAIGLLNPLLGDFPFIPFTGSSLRPFCMVHMVNDIIVNNRKKIIEFGSGISTIIIGRLIKKNNLNTTLLSIEHNESWVALLNELLKKEGLSDFVKVVWAPLTQCNLALESNHWYDLDIVRKALENNSFDMVIVDGPPAWEPSKEKARYPALPFMREYLSDKASIYLDDADRAGEHSILQLWQNKFSIRFNITGRTLGYAYLGQSFFTEPFSYNYRPPAN